ERPLELLNYLREPNHARNTFFALRRIDQIGSNVARADGHAVFLEQRIELIFLIEGVKELGKSFERPKALRGYVLERGFDSGFGARPRKGSPRDAGVSDLELPRG